MAETVSRAPEVELSKSGAWLQKMPFVGALVLIRRPSQTMAAPVSQLAAVNVDESTAENSPKNSGQKADERQGPSA